MEGCVFCNLNLERTRVISESENIFAILSNPALVEGHCLVIPKRHVEKLNELSEDERVDLFEQMIKLQELLSKQYNSGCDIRQNYRPFQKEGDLKVNHLHIHLQPRNFEDELYHKCQVFEKDLFRMLNENELDEVKKEVIE